MPHTKPKDGLDVLLSSLTCAVQALQSSLDSHNLPEFDFSAAEPHPLDYGEADPLFWYARKAIVGLCHQIIATVQSPAEKAYVDSISFLLPAAMNAALETEPPIADIIAEAGPEGETLTRICDRTGIDTVKLRPIFGVLTCEGYFKEVSRDCYKMTRPATVLLSAGKGAVPDLLSIMSGVSLTAASMFSQHVRDKTAPPEKTAFEIYHGLPFYAWIQQRPTDLVAFHHGLTVMDELVDGGNTTDYPWEELGQKITLVDVVCGNAELSFNLLKRFNGWRAVLQDRSEVVSSTEKAWRTLAPELVQSGRVKFLTHDFFQPTTLPAANDDAPYVFMMKRILHNWRDEECVRILKNLSPAAEPGTTLLLLHYTPPVPYPESDSLDVSHYLTTITGKDIHEIQRLHLKSPLPLGPGFGYGSALVPFVDMLMLTLFNSCGRSEPEMAALLGSSGGN